MNSSQSNITSQNKPVLNLPDQPMPFFVASALIPAIFFTLEQMTSL